MQGNIFVFIGLRCCVYARNVRTYRLSDCGDDDDDHDD